MEVSQSSLTTRQLKKRELDRKAQRQARERTKNRIAHLEALVAHLKNQSADSRVQSLMEHLSQVTKERDHLIGVLESMSSSLLGHLESAKRGPSLADMQGTLVGPEAGEAQPGLENVQDAENSESGQDILPQPSPSRFTHPLPLRIDGSSASPNSRVWLEPVPPNPGFASSQGLLDHDSHEMSFSTWVESIFDGAGPTQEITIPTPPFTAQAGSSGESVSTFSFWEAAEEVLITCIDSPRPDSGVEEAVRDDTAIRAVVDGWDEVERAGQMTETWCKLRQLDEVGWNKCQPTERLAFLRIMHIMITNQAEASSEGQSDAVPIWMQTRIPQPASWSCVVNVFIWPNLRERFMLSPVRYCADTFWHLFVKNLRILWPFEFRDSYAKNTETGQYLLRPQFEQCVDNMDSWTMCGEFFTEFPELYGAIPLSIEPCLV